MQDRARLRNPVEDAQRALARKAIRLILEDQYLVLITSDWLNRYVRDCRHGVRVRRVLRKLGPVRAARFQRQLERLTVTQHRRRAARWC